MGGVGGVQGGGVWGERGLEMAEEATAFYHDKPLRPSEGSCHTQAIKAVEPYGVSPPKTDDQLERAMVGLAADGRYCEAQLHQILGIPLSASMHQASNNNATLAAKQEPGQFPTDHLTAIRATKAGGCASCRTTKKSNSARRVRLSSSIAVIPRSAKLTRRSQLASSAFAASVYTPQLSEDDESDCESIMHEGLTTPCISTLLANSTTRKSPRCFVALDSLDTAGDSSDEESETMAETILFPDSFSEVTSPVLDGEATFSVAEEGNTVSQEVAHCNTSGEVDEAMRVEEEEHWSDDYDHESYFDTVDDACMSDDDEGDHDSGSDVPSQMSPPTLPAAVERRWLADIDAKSPNTSVFRHFERIRSVDEVEEEVLANVSPVDDAVQTEFNTPSTTPWLGDNRPTSLSPGIVTQYPSPSADKKGPAPSLAQRPGNTATTFNPFDCSPVPITTVPYSRGRKPPPVRSAFLPVASPVQHAGSWKINHTDRWQTAPGCGPVQCEPFGFASGESLTGPAALSVTRPDLSGEGSYRKIVPVVSRDLEALADWFALAIVTRLACPEPARANPHSSSSTEWSPSGVLNSSLERTGATFRSEHPHTPALAQPRSTHIHGSRPADPFGILRRHIYSNSRIKADSGLSMSILNIIESRCLSAERVIAAAWYLERFCVHDIDGPKGANFRHYLHAHGPDEKYPLELRLAITAFMIADIGVGDASDQWTLKTWATHMRIPTAHLHNLQLSALQNAGFSAVIQPSAWLEHTEGVYANVASAGFSDVRTGCRLLSIMDRMVYAAHSVVAQAEHDYDVYSASLPRSRRPTLPAMNESPTLASEEMRKTHSYAAYDGAADFPAPVFDDEVDDDDDNEVGPAPSSSPEQVAHASWPSHVVPQAASNIYTTAVLHSDLSQLVAMAPASQAAHLTNQQPGYRPSYNTTAQPAVSLPPADMRLTRWQVAPTLHADYPPTAPTNMPSLPGWQGQLIRV